MVTRGIRRIDGKIIGFYQLDFKLNEVLRRWASMKGVTKAAAAELLIASYYERMLEETALYQKKRDKQLNDSQPAVTVQLASDTEAKKEELQKIIAGVKDDIFAGGFTTEKEIDESFRGR